jgi:hypothetical protein
MGISTRCFALCAAILLTAWAFAQQPRTPTLEERVTALESSIATLDTRLERERTRVGDNPGQTDIGLSGRVQTLERNLDRLMTDLQRVERTAEDAARTANAAQRTAEQAARDALRR